MKYILLILIFASCNPDHQIGTVIFGDKLENRTEIHNVINLEGDDFSFTDSSFVYSILNDMEYCTHVIPKSGDWKESAVHKYSDENIHHGKQNDKAFLFSADSVTVWTTNLHNFYRFKDSLPPIRQIQFRVKPYGTGFNSKK